jgi:carboxypeptidase Q
VNSPVGSEQREAFGKGGGGDDAVSEIFGAWGRDSIPHAFHKTFLIGSAASLLCLTCAAQTPRPSTPSSSYEERIMRLMNSATGAWTTDQIATMGRLRDAAMQDSYALTELRHLTDNIGPRLSGSPQAQQAVEYVAAEMRELGAELQLEKTIVPHWFRGVETGELVGWPGQAPGTTQKIVLTALGGSGATPKDVLQAEVLVVNSFAELKQLPANAAEGKILLFNERFDKQLAAQGSGGAAYGKAVVYRVAGPNVAATVGAAAVLVRSVGGADYRLPHTGATLPSADGQPLLPAAAVTAEDADLLANLSRQGSVRMRLTLTPQTLPRVDSYNVIADWKGSEQPEQIVIVSGHLDSWDLGTGAIDDGAGVVISMQAIHLLKQLGKSNIDAVEIDDDVEGNKKRTS